MQVQVRVSLLPSDTCMPEYYHDPGSQAVYAVPARPNVIETRYGWEVQVAREVTIKGSLVLTRFFRAVVQ